MQNGVFVYNNKKRKIQFINNYLYKFEEFQDKRFMKRLNAKSDIETILFNNQDNNIKLQIENRLNFGNIIDLESLSENSTNLDNFNIFNKIFEINRALPTEFLEFIKYISFFDTINAMNEYYASNSNINGSEWLYLGQIKLKEKGQVNLFEFNINSK